ncbi:MAG TPA: glycoside hydrolase family 15 protein [Planctomycetota bacterium]|nr:glycoside hydrolase family 15 protein [Planctomycetota bacterium]
MVASEKGTPGARIPRLDHGVIGNGRVLALVSPTASVDWLCLPRFDSPSVFGRLLDHERGGTFRVLFDRTELKGRQRYIPNTNVLVTAFEHGDAAWEVVDFAPRLPDGWGVRAPLELARIVRPVRGCPQLSFDFDPRPDYARARPELLESDAGVAIYGGPAPFLLKTDAPIPYVLGGRPFLLARPLHFRLAYGRDAAPADATRLDHELEQTVEGWQAWAKTCALPLFAPDAVLRSALCLKLHAYEDTGAIIAATTTSIPEAMGTERTWDYRYCWLRDAAFTVEALRRLSHMNEGIQFIRFLRDVAESGPLQPVYGIDGRRDLEETFLPHLAGFGGNGFVRIGNAAAVQQQNDLFGEMILCLATLLSDPRVGDAERSAYFPLVERLVEEAIKVAPTDDMGIWEFRTMLRPYTFSRAMCWAAIDRGAMLAKAYGRDDLALRWGAVAAEEREVVLRRGYNAQRGFFTQALDGENPDAANLLFGAIGLIDGKDERFMSTVDAYDRLLGESGLLLRYRTLDDLGATTSAFTICSFWQVEALAMAGRLDEAVERFYRLQKYANPVGLFSEDIDPTSGALMGNFPQAYTHVGLVNAAMTIGGLLEAREGRIRPWS